MLRKIIQFVCLMAVGGLMALTTKADPWYSWGVVQGSQDGTYALNGEYYSANVAVAGDGAGFASSHTGDRFWSTCTKVREFCYDAPYLGMPVPPIGLRALYKDRDYSLMFNGDAFGTPLDMFESLEPHNSINLYTGYTSHTPWEKPVAYIVTFTAYGPSFEKENPNDPDGYTGAFSVWDNITEQWVSFPFPVSYGQKSVVWCVYYTNAVVAMYQLGGTGFGGYEQYLGIGADPVFCGTYYLYQSLYRTCEYDLSPYPLSP